MLLDFINDVCNMLKIEPPDISYDTSNFQTDTTLAQTKSDGSTIYIRLLPTAKPELFLSISHELRHVWQIRLHPEKYLKNYKTRDDCTSLVEYNLQLAEIDANAFASIVMMKFFKMKPIFKEFPKTVRAAINKRIDVMKTFY